MIVAAGGDALALELGHRPLGPALDDPAGRAAARRRAPRPSARRSRPSRSPAATRRPAPAGWRPGAAKLGGDQPALVVPLLVPRVGEEGPEPGQAVGLDQVLDRPDRVDAQQPHVGQPGRADPAQGVGDARAPDLEAPRRRGRAGRPRARRSTRRCPSRSRRSAAPRGRTVPTARSPARRPPRRAATTARRTPSQASLLARGEPAAAPGVGQHLAHPPAVLGQLLVRAGRVGRRSSVMGTIFP